MKKTRAKQIAVKALQTRARYLNITPVIPICPYNLAEAMGLDIRFVKISSFEGMYLADELVILIGAQRPEGRKSFTCAHEIGHHVLQHGTAIDEIIKKGPDKEIEKEADFFASMLLMPESLVRLVSQDLQINFSSPSLEKLYIASRYIGVSFMGFVTHLFFNLKLISEVNYMHLRNVNVGALKMSLAQQKIRGDVFVVGEWWNHRAVDMCVGDQLICEVKCEVEGKGLTKVRDGTSAYKYSAEVTGLSKVMTSSGWSSYIRVSRENYVGMNQYRFEEEVD